MGTDIHVVAQTRNADGQWVDCEGLPGNVENRNYTWFTFLDGCREQTVNRDRKTGIIPMPSRGCPPDFEQQESEYDSYHCDKWMGYGACGHATLEQILEHMKLQPTLEHRIGPIDEIQEFFSGFAPGDCRLVWGYDS